MNKLIIALILLFLGTIGFSLAGGSQYKDWSKTTHNKQQYLIKMGYTTGYADTIINGCKNIDGKLGYNKKTGKWDGEILSADKCIAWTSSVCKQESGAGTDERTTAICGVIPMAGKDYHVQLLDFIQRYSKYRYRHDTSREWLNLSLYCRSEGGKPYCSNRERNVQKYVEQYYSRFSKIHLAYKD